MTKFECEMALIKLAEAAQEVVKMYNAEINHTTITFNGCGFISVSAARFENMEMVENNLLNAVKFSNGELRFGGEVEESA